jgi:predicted nucleic acid-binding protein
VTPYVVAVSAWTYAPEDAWRAELDSSRASALGDAPPVIELADAVWDLRDELTAYDAAYLALARRLDVGLVTLDKGLAKAAAREGRLAPL